MHLVTGTAFWCSSLPCFCCLKRGDPALNEMEVLLGVTCGASSIMWIVCLRFHREGMPMPNGAEWVKYLQGVRRWLPLTSQSGEAAGAVQVAAFITHLDGSAVDVSRQVNQGITTSSACWQPR